MLTKDVCVRIAREKCVQMFGEDFVNAHKSDFSSSRFFDMENSILEYTLLFSPVDTSKKENKISIKETPFDYYVSVIVNMKDRNVYVNPDTELTKLPA